MFNPPQQPNTPPMTAPHNESTTTSATTNSTSTTANTTLGDPLYFLCFGSGDTADTDAHDDPTANEQPHQQHQPHQPQQPQQQQQHHHPYKPHRSNTIASSSHLQSQHVSAATTTSSTPLRRPTAVTVAAAAAATVTVRQSSVMPSPMARSTSLSSSSAQAPAATAASPSNDAAFADVKRSIDIGVDRVPRQRHLRPPRHRHNQHEHYPPKQLHHPPHSRPDHTSGAGDSSCVELCSSRLSDTHGDDMPQQCRQQFGAPRWRTTGMWYACMLIVVVCALAAPCSAAKQEGKCKQQNANPPQQYLYSDVPFGTRACTGCTFPARWEGSWFLSGNQQPVFIKGSTLSFRGKCIASEGDKFLVADE